LFKYRAPVPKSLAIYYVGILWLSFRTWGAQINVEAMEHGTTGMREAAVMMLEGDNWYKDLPPAEPVMLDSAEDMFERMAATPLRPILSDNAKYDATFPQHPLSLVRAKLDDVIATLQLHAAPDDLQPLRKGGWLKRWLRQ
jgi:hypothetical protein